MLNMVFGVIMFAIFSVTIDSFIKIFVDNISNKRNKEKEV